MLGFFIAIYIGISAGVILFHAPDAQDFVARHMARMLPNIARHHYPENWAGKPQAAQRPRRNYESYAEFTERRRRDTWRSSSFGRDYESYQDFRARYTTQDRSRYSSAESKRSYSERATQSVPHTPRLAALKTLGLSGQPTQAEIKSRYRKLAGKFHPDRHMAAGPIAVAKAEDKMKALNAAYDYLKKAG